MVLSGGVDELASSGEALLNRRDLLILIAACMSLGHDAEALQRRTGGVGHGAGCTAVHWGF